MDPQTSDWQAFKLWLAGYVPLERDMLHMLLGLALAAVASHRCCHGLRLRPFALALGAAFLAGLAMELADRRDDIATLGYWRLGTSLLDIGRTILAPALAVTVAGALLWRRGRQSGR